MKLRMIVLKEATPATDDFVLVARNGLVQAPLT